MNRERLKRRPVDSDVTQAVLDASGPSNEVKMLWLKLWSYRDRLDRVRRVSQAELAELLDYPQRTLRRHLADAHRWHMLSIHRGHHGGESWYVLNRPEHWGAAYEANRRAFLPPKRSAPSALASGAAAADDMELGEAADELLAAVPSEGVPNAETQKSTI
jgi:hypothetical protein